MSNKLKSAIQMLLMLEEEDDDDDDVLLSLLALLLDRSRKESTSQDSSRGNETKVFCPKCHTEVSHTAEGIQEDKTKILIAKVYHYFEQEYEELKKMYGDLDLTPLSKFRQRTALATGVSETTLLEILKEEEARNAEPPQKRRAALKRRRQTDSSSEEDSPDDIVEEVEQPSYADEVQTLVVKMESPEYTHEEPEIFIPPEMMLEPADGVISKEHTDPISVEVKIEPRDDEVDTTSETLAHNEPAATKRTGKKMSRKTDDTSTLQHTPSGVSSATVASSSAPRTETLDEFTDYEQQPAPCHSRQIPWDDDTAYAINYGSDASSDESGDEENVGVVIPRVLPRVLQTMLDTPLDEEYGDGAVAEPEAPAEPDSVPPTATDQPWRWYDFEWKDFPNSPIPTESRRETFSQSNVGPTIPRDDPYDIFVDIWDRPIMEYIASETNKYAQQVADQMVASNSLHSQSHIRRWYNTTADELYIYFGLLMAMGVVVKSRLEEYWSATSDILSTPDFSTHMSMDRFLLLSKCLHFNNNDDMCEQNLDASEARLFKIQPILSYLNEKFQEIYTPTQNIALDESLLMWKGWLDVDQLVPNNAAKKGIKTYEICEAQTGYLWQFEVHTQKSQLPPQQFEDPLEAPTPSIVLRLLQGLEHKGYTLWMDSYYNSPCLARRLKSLGFDCAGTLRTDRKFVPQVLTDLFKWNIREGQMSGLTSGDVDVTVWRDHNRVATISTYHGSAVQTLRGSTKPTVILDYNIVMGGVDRKDQLLAMYPVERKRNMVWYKTLFRRLLNVSVLNSFIIHRHSSSLSHRKFRIQLLESLLSRHRTLPIPNSLSDAPTHRFDASIHRIEEYDVVPKTAKKNARRPRRRCNFCVKRVSTFCVGCKKTLCLKNCFLLHHS